MSIELKQAAQQVLDAFEAFGEADDFATLFTLTQKMNVLRTAIQQAEVTQAEVTDELCWQIWDKAGACDEVNERVTLKVAKPIIRAIVAAYLEVAAHRGITALRPAAVPMTDEHLSVLKEMADRCPELNLSNYDSDDVDELNSWAVEIAVYIDGITAQAKEETP